jgi:electron transfer flavoprotein alpha subunit
MTVLVIAEHDNVYIKGVTLHAVMAASHITLTTDEAVHVMVLGNNCQQAGQAAAQMSGVTKILHADGEGLAHGLVENMTTQILTVAQNYSHILLPATVSGFAIATLLAAKLNVGQILGISRSDSHNRVECPTDVDNAIATLQCTERIKIIIVRTTDFDPVNPSGGSAPVEPMAAVAASDKPRFLGNEITKTDGSEFTAAKVIVAGWQPVGFVDEFTELLMPPSSNSHRCNPWPDFATGASTAAPQRCR